MDLEQQQQQQQQIQATTNDINEEEEEDLKTVNGNNNINGVVGRLREWHPSSRIIRVSRASGGKDRHSKVLTSKGLRDRRVRLSVTTAIQFYDLQDRLGYDQPSKAVEWLIKAASESINELPSLNAVNFSNVIDDDDHNITNDSAADVDDIQLDMSSTSLGHAHGHGHGHGHGQQQQQQHLSLSKSACSSTSDTSTKGSGGLSLTRSNARVKARERARERSAGAAKEKLENDQHQQHSFTELLTGAVTANATATASGGGSRQWAQQQQQHQQAMEYFSSGLLGPTSLSSSRNFHTSSTSTTLPQFNENHFCFMNQHLVPTSTSTGGSDYNFINFNLAAGFNRGTLQSNSTSSSSVPSFSMQLQHTHNNTRYAAAAAPNLDGSNLSFFNNIATSTPPHSTLDINNHHHQGQFPLGLDDAPGLQLLYGDGTRHSHSDQKGKGKH
ncbi:hypothetical protein ACFE04_014470 [Oxalis oulophora]